MTEPEFIIEIKRLRYEYKKSRNLTSDYINKISDEDIIKVYRSWDKSTETHENGLKAITKLLKL